MIKNMMMMMLMLMMMMVVVMVVMVVMVVVVMVVKMMPMMMRRMRRRVWAGRMYFFHLQEEAMRRCGWTSDKLLERLHGKVAQLSVEFPCH